MGKKSNKVFYGLSNVHYAVATYNQETDIYTYGTPVRIPGAVSTSLSAQGSIDDFYADNGVYDETESNTGYSGDIVFARVIDKFREDVLNESNGLENANNGTNEFALLFEFSGDKTHTRYVFYRTRATRPDVASETTTDTKTPKTETLNVKCTPRLNDGYVKCYVTEDDPAYNDFYTKVYEPADILKAAGGAAANPGTE